MEVGVLGDHTAILMEMAASRADDDIEIVDCVEVFVGERFVDERPEVLGWLQFRAVGWLVDEPDERLWGVMHKHVTHNKCYATCAQFADATLGFLREKVPRNWADLCDSVTDNFRIINPKDFRVVT